MGVLPSSDAEPTLPPKVSSNPVESGSQAERYEHALQLWDTGDGEKIREAIQICIALCKEDVDFSGPYRKVATVMCNMDEVGNSGTIVSTLKKAYALAPDDPNIRHELQTRLFTHGKVNWDREKPEEAFNSYMEGLELFTASGEQFGQSSPLPVRIAFVASRMFSKNAMDLGNNNMGIRLIDWCKKSAST